MRTIPVMPRMLLLAAIAAVLTIGPASADGLDCGKPSEAHPAADRALAQAITSPNRDTGAATALRNAVKRLKADGVTDAMIVDHAVAAYCPLVAKDESLSLTAKRENVRRFASELTSYVYDPAQGEDALILSLPVPPSLSAQIDAAAAKAGQTRDAWLTTAIRKALVGE